MEKTAVQRKKDFIVWLLGNFQLKQRECFWIMNEMIKNEKMLETVVFVDDVTGLENALEMSTYRTDTKAFVYYKSAVVVTDANLMWEKVRENIGSTLFIQVNFPGREESEKYAEAKTDKTQLKQMLKEKEMFIENLIQEIVEDATKQRLKVIIEESLVEKNKEKFWNATEMMKRIEKKEKET